MFLCFWPIKSLIFRFPPVYLEGESINTMFLGYCVSKIPPHSLLSPPTIKHRRVSIDMILIKGGLK